MRRGKTNTRDMQRRSTDGFVSATGMFKAAFPYAQVEDETAEKDYIKTLSGTSSEEVAGNVWIDAEQGMYFGNVYIDISTLTCFDSAHARRRIRHSRVDRCASRPRTNHARHRLQGHPVAAGLSSPGKGYKRRAISLAQIGEEGRPTEYTRTQPSISISV